MLVVCCVALGGVIGAPARFLLDRFVADHIESDFPFGTFVVNASGSFVLGAAAGLVLTGHLSAPLEALIGTGFCGAYTTFSTWSYETVHLLEEREVLQATLNIAFSMLVGLLAAGVGLALGLLR